MNIFIHFFSLNQQEIYEIDDEKKLFKYNGDNIKADCSNISQKISLLSQSWPKKLENQQICDGLKFKITIEDKGDKKTYIFKNDFPANFPELTEVLDDSTNIFRDL